MSARRRRIYLGCLVLHLGFVFLAATHDLASALGESGTIFPASFRPIWQRAEAITFAALGKMLSEANPVRQALATYLNITGIESGYGFFAPNVPNSYKLVFEIRYGDGRVEYQLPRVGSNAAGLRVVALLDNISAIDYELLRRTTLKMLAFAVWREHPDAEVIRVVFGMVKLPRIEQFVRGEKETYEFLYAYDFRFPPSAALRPVR